MKFHAVDLAGDCCEIFLELMPGRLVITSEAENANLASCGNWARRAVLLTGNVAAMADQDGIGPMPPV